MTDDFYQIYQMLSRSVWQLAVPEGGITRRHADDRRFQKRELRRRRPKTGATIAGLFAQLVFPQLIKIRTQLEKAYSLSTGGRVAIEPVLLLGVSLLQYLDGVPDRGAVDLLRYHSGWNFAMNCQLGDELFHPTTLSKFRDRLIEHDVLAVGFTAILDGLVAAGLISRNSRQRLDSTQVFGLVSKMSRVEGVRKSLRLALEEIDPRLPESDRPPDWAHWWERYVESKLDYKASPLSQRN